MSLRLCCSAILIALASLLLSVPSLLAQAPTIQLWQITFTDQADLNRLATELDVWEVDHTAHQLLAPLSTEQAALLQQTRQLTLAPDQSPLEPPAISAAQTSGIPGFACYRTLDETFATLDQLALDYPNLVQQVDMGDSWDKAEPEGPAGDDLRAIVLSNQQITTPKFRFMLMGAIHAREYTTTELALRFAESLLQEYGHDATATWLLDHGELHLLPIANPDGRRIAETGQLWRKNTNKDACFIENAPSPQYGVDLNRNSSFQWNSCPGCSSAYSCSETYRGIAPASEPEVEAIEAYMRSIFGDQRGPSLDESAPASTPGLFISLHSYGQLVLFPWGWTTTHAPNGHDLATLARRLGYHLNYRVCQAGGSGCLYQTDGTTDDWAYGELGLAAFTIELGTDFFQSCSYFESNILPQGLAALRYAFTAAPRPYQLANGPEILDLALSPQDLGTGTHVTITATASASRMAPLSGDGNSSLTEPADPIQAARLTIDQLPWSVAPATLPLAAVDGQFDSPQEAVTATAEMACLPSGRHTLYLQAQDSAGDWGVAAAEFVTITNDSPFTATVLNDRGSTKSGQPLTYSFTLTNTSATTATYAIETRSELSATVTPSAPITLAAGASAQLILTVTPTESSASTVAPALLIIRSIEDSSRCRQLQVTTEVIAWNYRQILQMIRKP
ncbi:MAG: peptidase M14 [Caldilineaceae bacterium]|nr:peptidase M14 [Caldilineaceae bacterium]